MYMIAWPLDTPPQRIAVKARTFASSGTLHAYDKIDVFDWLAVMI